MVYKICHDTVTGTDYLIDGAGAVFNKLLRVAKPYVGTVCESGDLKKIGKVFRLRFKKFTIIAISYKYQKRKPR